MSKDILFQRVLENKCPICLKVLKETDDTVIEEYNEARLKICSKHIKYPNLSEIRVSKKARWTGNFTPPTEELKDE